MNLLAKKLMSGTVKPPGWEGDTWSLENLATIISCERRVMKKLKEELRQRMKAVLNPDQYNNITLHSDSDGAKREKIWSELAEDEEWRSVLDTSALFSGPDHKELKKELPNFIKVMRFKLETDICRSSSKLPRSTPSSTPSTKLVYRGASGPPQKLEQVDTEDEPGAESSEQRRWRPIPAVKLQYSDLTFLVQYGEKVQHIALFSVVGEDQDRETFDITGVSYPRIVQRLAERLGFDEEKHTLGRYGREGAWEEIDDDMDFITALEALHSDAGFLDIKFEVVDRKESLERKKATGVSNKRRKIA